MLKKFLELTLSVFLLVCTIAIVIAIINSKDIADKYVASLNAQIDATNEIKNSINQLSTKYLPLIDAQVKGQQEFLGNYKKINEVLYEAGIAIGARIMEEEGGMSPTDANIIISESIDNIRKHSERLGVLGKAINDASRR